jgi:rare lipoprotein A
MHSGFGRTLRLLAASMALGGLLAGCGSDGFHANSGVERDAFTSAEYGVVASPRVSRTKNPPKGGGRYQVGKPYTVGGKRYVPQDNPDYAAAGTASWYGADFHGRRTANGEIFSANALTAAHPTLPLPSYVRVTNTDNGRSIIVRVNDRGPYVHGRIIDLSARAASMLGYIQSGVGNVEVSYVGKAPLNGDDTRFLLASYNRLTPFEQQTRLASSEPDLPEFQLRSLLSYADGVPQPRSDALYAAAMLAEGGLPPLPGVSLDLRVGTFDADRAVKVSTALAQLAVVAEEPTGQGTRVIVKALKPGVGSKDLSTLARELGLADPFR